MNDVMEKEHVSVEQERKRRLSDREQLINSLITQTGKPGDEPKKKPVEEREKK